MKKEKRNKNRKNGNIIRYIKQNINYAYFNGFNVDSTNTIPFIFSLGFWC